jgi:hypothetical protein
MDRKERALELARQQYADGGGPRYTPSYTEHGALIGPSMRDRANMVRDAFDSAAGHPFVRVAREYPREMAQEIGSSVVGGIKAAPSAAKNLAVNTARYVYNNPSAAAGNALEFAAGMSPSPVAMFFWGPGGMLSPSSAKAPELDPEIAMRHAQAQEARLMQNENYAGGYAEGGEVREAHSNGKRVIGPLATAAESAMTKAAEKILAEKMAERAARYVEDPEVRAANLKAYRGNTPQEVVDQRWYHGTDKDFPEFNEGVPIFLTPSPRFANRFSIQNAPTGELVEGTGVNPNVMPLIPRAENPFDFENRKHAKALETYLKPEMKNDAYLRYQFDSLKQGDWQEIESKKIQDAIKALGHDSFYVDEYGTKNLAVYSPNQVKSDIGNAGTFDFGTPRLTEAKGGTVVDRAIMLASKMA